MRGQDRYGCSSHVMTGPCANGRGIRRVEIEERVLAGLKDRLMAPEAAAEAMKAYAEETNRLNRERRASGAADRQELAELGRKIKAMVSVIEDGGYARGRHAGPHARTGSLPRRDRRAPRRGAGRPARPGRGADAVRGLIERIVLTPGEKRGRMDAALHGDLGTILEWAACGAGNRATDIPMPEMSVSVVAGARFDLCRTRSGCRASRACHPDG